MAGVGTTPGSAVVAEDIRNLESGTDHRAGVLCRRLVPLGAYGREAVEWTGDRTNGRGSNLGIQRCGVEPGVTQEGLNHTNIDLLFEQMSGEGMPQCVRRHSLSDPCGVSCCVNNSVELACCEMVGRVLTGK